MLCAVVGVFLAVSPHLATVARHGTPDFLADQDDIFYLALSRTPYYGGLTLRGPYSGPSAKVPVPYAWLQFVPLAKLTRLLGLPLPRVSLVGRGGGGCLLGCAVFVLFRRLLATTGRPTAWALGCSLVCLADGGFIEGRTVLRNFLLLQELRMGTTPTTSANSLPQYRFVWPLLNLPFLLFLIAVLVPGPRGGHRVALTGIAAFGLCVLLLFYMWTAAALALGFYLVAMLCLAWWSPERAAMSLRRARLVGVILAGGMTVGSPQIYHNWKTLNDPDYKSILERVGLSRPLEPGDPHRGNYLANKWAWAKLAIGAVGIFALGSEGLLLLWCFCAAGFALVNSAIVTGLEFENFHWSIVCNPIGEIMVLTILATMLDRRCRGRGAWLAAAWALPCMLLSIAFLWRPYEAIHAPEAAENSRLLQELRTLESGLSSLDPGNLLATPRGGDVALLFTRCNLLYGYYTWFSLIHDDAVHERHALSAWLQGMDEAAYAREITLDSEVVFSLYPGMDAEEAAARSARAGLFRSLLTRPDLAASLMGRHRVGHLLLPASSPRPERGGPWTPVDSASGWTLWSIDSSRANETEGRGPGSQSKAPVLPSALCPLHSVLFTGLESVGSHPSGDYRTRPPVEACPLSRILENDPSTGAVGSCAARCPPVMAGGTAGIPAHSSICT